MKTFIYFVYYIFFGILIYIIMRVIKKKYIGQMILLIMAISIFNNGVIWLSDTSKKVDDKIDKWNKKIDSIEQKFGTVGETIDKTNDTVEKMDKQMNFKNSKAIKSIDKGLDKADKLDKRLKDIGFKIREKITGKKVSDDVGKEK